MITNEITREEPHLSFEPVIELPEIPEVKHNLNVVKQYAQDLKDFWQPVIFTSEQVDKAKEVRIGINKLVKKVGDLRKETVKEYKKPIDDFEKTAKETEAILKEASEVLTNKINVFVEQEQNEKKEKIGNIILEKTKNSEVTFHDIQFDSRWLNKTYKLSDIEKDIDNQIKEFTQLMETKKLAKENLRLKLEQLDPGHLLTHEVYLTKLDYVDNVDMVFASALEDFKKYTEIAEPEPVNINDIFKTTTYKVTFEGSFEEIQKLKEFAKANNIKEV